MLYLLFVLTFLCGILFYGLSPHDKRLDMSEHQAEALISSFVAQHQAAKDYLFTWLGADRTDLIGNVQKAGGYLKTNFEAMMPYGVTSEMCSDNHHTSSPGTACFVSRVYCTDSSGNNGEANWDPAVCLVSGKRRYVVTYGGWEKCGVDDFCRPGWWPSKGRDMRLFESWRRAVAGRTRDSISCGVLYWNGSSESVNNNNWCIDNGKRVFKKDPVSGKQVCMTTVPPGIIEKLYTSYGNHYTKLHDMLFCISEFKQGLDGYVSGGLTHFYDGFANAGIGKHVSGNNDKNWVNLGSAGGKIKTTDDLTLSPTEPFLRTNGLQTVIPLPNDAAYTLTVIAALPEANTFHLLKRSQLADAGDEGEPVFTKEGKIEGTDAFVLRHWENDTSVQSWRASACNMNRNGEAKGIISWTFVVQPIAGSKYQTIDVYENAVKRSYFSNKKIKKPSSGEVLKLGGSVTWSSGSSTSDVGRIYGIRFYTRALEDNEIQKNFKMDQKRFSIPDINNSDKARPEGCINESDVRAGILEE